MRYGLIRHGYVRKYGSRRARRYTKQTIVQNKKGYQVTSYSKPKYNRKNGRWGSKQKVKVKTVKTIPRSLRNRIKRLNR